MCHPEVPAGWEAVEGDAVDVTVPLPTGELMPALRVGDTGHPGVVLIPDVYGRSAFYENLAQMIAAGGLQVLLPEFFFRQGPLEDPGHEAAFARRAKLDERQSLEDIRATVDLLREQSGGTLVGVIGFCMGGTFALDLASTETDLVTVAYYGFPVPQTSIPQPPPRPIDLVEGLRGPVLAFWGDADQTVGIDNVRSYITQAGASNSEFHGEVLPGLGHGFLGAADLGNQDDPATETWRRTLSHLRTNLLEGARS